MLRAKYLHSTFYWQECAACALTKVIERGHLLVNTPMHLLEHATSNIKGLITPVHWTKNISVYIDARTDRYERLHLTCMNLNISYLCCN